MKRALFEDDTGAETKRNKSSVGFYGTGSHAVHEMHLDCFICFVNCSLTRVKGLQI